MSKGGPARGDLPIGKVRDVLAALFEERHTLKRTGETGEALQANKIAIEYWQEELERLEQLERSRRRGGGRERTA